MLTTETEVNVCPSIVDAVPTAIAEIEIAAHQTGDVGPPASSYRVYKRAVAAVCLYFEVCRHTSVIVRISDAFATA